MIASLPMYLHRENQIAHDIFYALIRDALRDRGESAPEALDHTAPIWNTWSRPDLTLGQICNLPHRTAFISKVTLIGAADYGLPHAPAGQYYSVIITRKDDNPDPTTYAQRLVAYNQALSQSGWGSLVAWGQAHGITWTRTLKCGAHIASATAVVKGHADIAAIDAQSWRNIARFTPLTDSLQIVGRTACSAALTYITAAGRDPATYFAAISDAITALPSHPRALLNLQGVVALPNTHYTDLSIPYEPPC